MSHTRHPLPGRSPQDRFPVPLHWHEREHDTWFCTRGRMTVWGNGQGRALYPGDFAYVPPGQVHAFQCTGADNAFFGLVAPGGWEAFFGDAGTQWHAPDVPPAGSQPFDLPRMIAAQAKHRVMRVDAPYPALSDEPDDALPETSSSYFLRAGCGPRTILHDMQFTLLVGPAQTAGLFAMHTVQAGPHCISPDHILPDTYQALHVLRGVLHVTVDGTEHVLSNSDTVSIPAGARRGLRVGPGAAEWISCTSGGAPHP